MLVGDFNFNDIDWNIWISTHNSGPSSQFTDVLRNNFLLQHIDFPTRARGLDSPHILDLVITDKESVENIDYLAPMGKSDHSVLLIYANSHANNAESIPKLNLNKGNYSELRKFLNINWDSLLQPYVNNVEMMWNAIKSKLLNCSSSATASSFLGSTSSTTSTYSFCVKAANCRNSASCSFWLSRIMSNLHIMLT